MTCLSETELLDLRAGTLSPDEADRVDDHLDSCAQCRRLVAEVARVEDGDARDIEVPTVGRFVVLSTIGAGGMGLVYEAYDPALGRRIALKVIGGQPGRSLPDSHALEEARAMAQVSHPNVVQVFDVGTFNDRVFIAMELVDGETLADWLRRAPRTWTEITRVFEAAGRGLHAAHTAGLVHGDFKPGNVLLGQDGRARVADFGLAQLPGGPQRKLAGTPGFIAPELQEGHPTDVRADQYSFCVALAGALEGKLPRSQQRRLGRVIARGAAPKPEARHLSMEPILRAMARALSSAEGSAVRGWMVLLGLAGLVLSVAGIALVWQRRRVSRPPAAIAQRVRELQGRLDQVRTLSASGRGPEASQLGDQLVKETAALGYPPIHAEAALANGQALFREGKFAAARDAFVIAVTAAQASQDDSIAARAWTAEAEALDRLGHYDEALERITLADAALKRSGPDALKEADLVNTRGRILLSLGRLSDAEALLRQGLALREAQLPAGHPSLAGTLHFLGVCLLREGRVAEAHAVLLRALDIRTTALGPDHLDLATILTDLGDVETRSGDPKAALAHLEKALRLREGQLPPTHPDTAETLVVLGEAQRAAGQREAARQSFERAVPQLASALGDSHPDTQRAKADLDTLSR